MYDMVLESPSHCCDAGAGSCTGTEFCGPALWKRWCCTVSVSPVSTGATFSRGTRMYTSSSPFCVDAAGAAGSVSVATAFEAVLYPLAPAVGVTQGPARWFCSGYAERDRLWIAADAAAAAWGPGRDLAMNAFPRLVLLALGAVPYCL